MAVQFKITDKFGVQIIFDNERTFNIASPETVNVYADVDSSVINLTQSFANRGSSYQIKDLPVLEITGRPSDDVLEVAEWLAFTYFNKVMVGIDIEDLITSESNPLTVFVPDGSGGVESTGYGIFGTFNWGLDNDNIKGYFQYDASTDKLKLFKQVGAVFVEFGSLEDFADHISDTNNPHLTSLQQAIDEGNTVVGSVEFQNSTSGVVFKDDNNDITGYIAGTPDFGVSIFGTSDGVNSDKPITLAGNTVIIGNDNLLIQKEGAETGDFLRIINAIVVNGRTLFTVDAVALETTLYSEKFENGSNVTLLNGVWTNIVQSTNLNNTYTDGNSQATYSFQCVNNNNSDRTLEFSITNNDGTPSEVFTRNLPNKGTITIISGSDSVTGGDIVSGSTIEIQARTINGTGVTVQGSITPTTLSIEQNTNTTNLIQSSDIKTFSSSLDVNVLNKVTANDNYFLPELSSITYQEDKIELIIYNDSDNIATIRSIGADVINLPQNKQTTSIKIYPYESYRFFAESKDNGFWGVLESNKRTSRVVESNLDAKSFVNQLPNGTDSPLQATFGPAQGVISDPVMIDALGNTTFNEEGVYRILIEMEYGRNGNAGESELRFRGKLNGQPIGIVLSAILDSSRIRVPLAVSFWGSFSQSDVLTFEFYRDSSGNNSGGLYTSSSSLAGWDDSPSARLLIQRLV